MVRPRPPCGTDRGYQYHLRHGEPTCMSCKAATNIRQRIRRQTIITCRDCKKQKPQWARGRCLRCYERQRDR